MALQNSKTRTSHKPSPLRQSSTTTPTLVRNSTEESTSSTIQVPVHETRTADIEHVPVQNDPRAWSPLRKNVTLFLVASASMIAGLAGNIQNPAVEEMERDLPATSAQFSLSISMFILIQGLMPLLWSAISEVKGRKLVYIVSLALFTLGTIIVALSSTIGLVIGFRCLQAAGSSAVIAIGAASLADIFEPEERGKKMGIYYIAPLLGPAIGPILGGGLTTAFNWRAIFWFMSILSGTSLLSFIFFFNDTFRRERSLSYQIVVKQHLRAAALHPATLPSSKADQKIIQNEKSKSEVDIEKNEAKAGVVDSPKDDTAVALPAVNLSITDVNPFKPIGRILGRKNNILILISSGLLFSFNFLVLYTSSRTLSAFYHFDPLKIGFVTISYGVGCVTGSVFGGLWSDYELTRLKAVNGGHKSPEMRLRSTFIGLCMLPPCVLGLGWVSEERVHVSAMSVFLFACGFFSIWVYSSALTYIIDANNGRSSTAVATNSAFRGVSAFVATEIAVPLQDGLGDGWMYTIWAAIMVLSSLLIILVWWKGGKWREEAEAREAETAKRLELSTPTSASTL